MFPQPASARHPPYALRPHDFCDFARCSFPRPGRAWLSSYYLVFLACFLDLAESSKKAHRTEGTSGLRHSKKEGCNQKQSNLQGNPGSARTGAHVLVRPLRMLPAAPPGFFTPLRFFSFGVSVSDPRPVPPEGARPARCERGSRDRAAASTARISYRTHHACSLDDLFHAFTFFSHFLTNFIGRESSRCLTSSVIVAQSARLPLEATLFRVPM